MSSWRTMVGGHLYRMYYNILFSVSREDVFTVAIGFDISPFLDMAC